MKQHMLIKIEVPVEFAQFKLPPGVNGRLQNLLNRRDRGECLTDAERQAAEGLVNLAELLSLLRLRSQIAWSNQQ